MIEEAPIKTTVEELRKLIHISNYIGEPIESEDKILIPVSKAAVGFGIGEQKAGQEGRDGNLPAHRLPERIPHRQRRHPSLWSRRRGKLQHPVPCALLR